MKKNLDDIIKDLLNILSQGSTPLVPEFTIRNQLRGKYPSGLIDDAINQAIREFRINKVIDRTPDDEYMWFLTILEENESQKLRNLKPVDLALLNLLRNQNNPAHLGEIRLDRARTLLREEGYDEKELRFLWISGIVDNVWISSKDGSVKWCRLIPEYEKTEEYQGAVAEAQKEWDEKESVRLHYLELDEIALEIRNLVADSSNGLPMSTLEEHIKKYHPFIDFKEVIHNAEWLEYIEQIPNLVNKDEPWYRSYPHSEDVEDDE